MAIGFGGRGMPRATLTPAPFLDPTSFRPLKMTDRIFPALLASLIIFGSTGCHKNATADSPKTLEQGVDQLRAALVSASPTVQSNLYQGVCFNIRYGDFAKASSSLQQIASDPSLNEQQKKAVNDVGELLKQALASPPNAAQPAH